MEFIMNDFMCFIKSFFILLILLGNCTNYGYSSHYSQSTLNDGAHRILIDLKGIKATQVVVGPKEGIQSGIVVRQISNGIQMVNLVYNGLPSYLKDVEGISSVEVSTPSLVNEDQDHLSLRDCRVDKDKKQVDEYLQEFQTLSIHAEDGTNFDLSPLAPLNTTYIIVLNEESLPNYLKPLINFSLLKSKCFELRRKIRKLTIQQNKERRHNEEILKNGLQRSRRSLHELFILPGTKWCGSGRLARDYNDLAGYSVADNCCRVHDLCPSSIPGFSRKYGFYNYSLTTISHCHCDKRFKTCLKQTGTGASDVVGNVFFNIVKSQCFVFQRRKVCKKRGFWSCLRWGYEKQAVVRDPVRWNW